MKKGCLFLIVGNSGTGKDTIINYVTERIEALCKVKRCITRKEHESSEDFTSLTRSEFNEEDFFIKWESYDKNYGIPLSVLNGLEKGESYAINVSRSVISEVRRKWLNTFVVELTVPLNLLKKRLEKRKRESAEEIRARLNRAVNAPKLESDIIINTSDSNVEIAGEQVLKFIKKNLT